ncbi:FAD-dependent oxidoreductase [Rhizohabitans arisaemae]|uniref:FAD-dependent oxidoreductase n=1 Tax=Rhizohabitans arisaemae TaxID=2720610 RepID=UPI0024B0E84F|nr:FAD-dependent monooxygenase [Rhizohabitans arisaemae]
MTDLSTVLIAGAGLGGLCLAQGLRKAGIDAVVLERDTSPNTRGQGHRVHIDSRGEAALRSCLPPALYDLYEGTCGQPSERFMLISAEGPRLEEVPVPPVPGGSTTIRAGRAVSRQTLREILLADLDDTVLFGKRLVGYRHEEGGVRARFADGTSYLGDLLVGADGIGSAVRRQLLPHAELADVGIRWIGGKSPISKEITSALPEGLSRAFAAVTGMRPAMLVGYMRFATHPNEAGTRSGVRLTESDDYVMWAITIQTGDLPHADAELAAMSGQDLFGVARRLAGTVHPVMRDIVGHGRPEQTFFLQLGSSVPVEAWPASNVTLLGDAIHAMPPSLGSGANTALADAASLTAGLAAVRQGHLSLLTAVAEYETDMLTRGFTAVNASVNAIDTVARRIVS